jgi:transposase
MYEKQGADLTMRIQERLSEVGELSAERRALWFEANRAGVSQSALATAAGVVTHTVYSEIRKHREEALVDSAI